MNGVRTFTCEVCGKDFTPVQHRRFCTVGCEMTWWAGTEAEEENHKLRDELAAEKARHLDEAVHYTEHLQMALDSLTELAAYARRLEQELKSASKEGGTG